MTEQPTPATDHDFCNQCREDECDCPGEMDGANGRPPMGGFFCVFCQEQVPDNHYHDFATCTTHAPNTTTIPTEEYARLKRVEEAARKYRDKKKAYDNANCPDCPLDCSSSYCYDESEMEHALIVLFEALEGSGE